MLLKTAATTGMLLAIRRSLIEETGAATTSDMMLIDIAVIAFANAMRIQSMVGNTALLIEAELFCQPSLRAKWEQSGRSAKINGLSIDEHVTRLSEHLMPLIERFNRMARENIGALGRMRGQASSLVERARPLAIVLGP